MSVDADITRLVEWATSHGAQLHPSVEIYQDVLTGLSFRVKQASLPSSSPLPAWESVVSIPDSLTLSFLNALSEDAGRQHPFTSNFIRQTPPHVVGRFFLVWQYLLGEASFWWPYIRALPQPNDDDESTWRLAPFWPTDDAELLEGTNVEVGLEKIRKEVRNEYSRAAELLSACRTGDEDHDGRLRSMTMGLYQWAYCIFSSRSFRPSLVLAEDDERVRLPEGVKMDDFSVLLPLFDIGNHDMKTEVRWNVVRGQADGQPQISHEGAVLPSSRCELRVGREFLPGQQVFNNYSMKTNAELLLGYGFMIPATEDLHNDYVHVRKRAAASLSDEYYISLRPTADDSSVLGQYKQSIKLDKSDRILGAFRHLQTDMVWDIFTTILASTGKTLDEVLPLPPANEGSSSADQERERVRAFFRGDVGEVGAPYVEQTAAIIQHKVFQELERLDETEVEVDEDEVERLTANQRLALEYRKRCRAVLENTLEAIDMTLSGGDAM